MNKTILKYEPDLNFVLVAITATLKDYKLCFKINKQLGTNFNRINELELVFNTDESLFYFSRYYYKNIQTETEYYILSNKGTEGFLVPEMKEADFFLLIRNYIDNEDLRTVIIALNKIPEVVVAAEVNPKKLKSKENLIF
ncbi:MAG: IPExxxVDY family protein [Daejeonella sp.]